MYFPLSILLLVFESDLLTGGLPFVLRAAGLTACAAGDAEVGCRQVV